MSKMSFVTDMILDTFKRVLVRFKNAKFGLLFFINILKYQILTDNRVNIFSKFKLIFFTINCYFIYYFRHRFNTGNNYRYVWIY